MNLDAIANDPIEIDKNYPGVNESFVLNSHGHNAIGTMFIAQGKGPHPTIILFHGFPGYEKNFDLAHILRRAGYNVMIFHYRGSWGSEGTYSIGNVLQDAEVAVDFLRSEKSIKDYRVNPDKIILMGHSLGGFTAFLTAANHPEIKSVAFLAGFNFGYYGDRILTSGKTIASLAEQWKYAIPPLKGTTAEEFVNDIIENRENWNLLNVTEKLKNHSILMIAGKGDKVATIREHHEVLAKELKSQGVYKLKEVILDSGHEFIEKRITLAKELLIWLEEQ